MTNTKLQASPQRLPTQTRSKGTGVHGVRVSSEGIGYNGRDWTFPPQKEAGSSSRGPGPALTQSYKHSSHLASQMDAACPISVCSVFQKRPIMYTLFQQRKNKSISADPVSPAAPAWNTDLDAKGASASCSPAPSCAEAPTAAPRGPYLGLGRSLPRLFWHHSAPSPKQHVSICDGSRFWDLPSSHGHTGGGGSYI